MQCRDHRAGPNSLDHQATCQRVGRLVEFAETDGAAVIGDGGRVPVQGCGVAEQSAERAMAADGQESPHRLVGST